MLMKSPTAAFVSEAGAARVARVRIRVDLHVLGDSQFPVMALAKEQAVHALKKLVGTAVGTTHYEHNLNIGTMTGYMELTATWVSRCRAPCKPKPELNLEDLFKAAQFPSGKS